VIAELTENQQSMLTYCEMMKRMRVEMGAGDEFVYKGMEHFLLDHGCWYEPTSWDAEKYNEGIPRACFHNSMNLASGRRRLRYVEGYAYIEKIVGFPIHHAWNLDSDGRLVDTTWRNTGVLYFGVEFSTSRAKAIISPGEATVLDNWRDGHSLFRQPWAGEDFAREWKGTKRSRARVAAESELRA
jgi:hypothetical protein